MVVEYRHAVLILIMLFLSSFAGCASNTEKERVSEKERISYEVPGSHAGTPGRTAKKDVHFDGENVGGLGEAALRTKLQAYAVRTDIAPKNAAVNPKTWEITADKPGRKLNADKTLDALLNAPQGKWVGPVAEEAKPAARRADLLKNIRLLADFTTEILDDRASRVNNIRISIRKIDHTILSPGEEFSFNGTLGRRTAAKGYEEAPIIVHTPYGPTKKMAKGGGICQVSTTLYNAVQKCGLKITERHLHSMEIGYVPMGNDATVSYGTADFRFVNNRSFPVMLRLQLKGNFLTVRLLENRNSPNTALRPVLTITMAS